MKLFFLFFISAIFTTKVVAKTIFVVESYHEAYPWVQEYRQGLEDTLRSEHDLIYFELDSKRLPESEFSQKADEAWTELINVSPDFIIIADDNALRHLAPRLNRLGTQFVYLGINGNPRHYGLDLSNHTGGVLERPEIRASLAELQDVIPLDKVLILNEQSTTSDAILKYMLGDKRSLEIANVHVDFVATNNFLDWKSRVVSAGEDGYSAIFIGLYQALKEKSGKPVAGNDVISWTSEHTKIPLFALYDYAVGPQKASGGLVLSGYEQGVQAGQITMNYFQDKKRSSLPSSRKNGVIIFSRAQASKWNLNITRHLSSRIKWVD